MELKSLRLNFLFTIFVFFLFSFSFFFLHLLSHSLLPSPQKPKTVFPSSYKSISQNPEPKSRFHTRAPWVWQSRHRRNIFYCGFVFSVLPSSSKSISQNPKPKSQSQSEQKLLWVRVFSIGAKTVESRSQSEQKLLWVRGSCFLGWSVVGNSSLRDLSSTCIFLIRNRVFETQFAIVKLSLIDSSCYFPK